MTVSGARKGGPRPRTWPSGTDQPGPLQAASDGVGRRGARPGAGRGTPTRECLTRLAPGAAGRRSDRRAPGAPAAPAAGARRSRPPRSAAGPRSAGTAARPARRSASSRSPTRAPPTPTGAAPPRRRPGRRPAPPGPPSGSTAARPRGIICARALAWGARRPWKRSRWNRGDGMSTLSFSISSRGSSSRWVEPSRRGEVTYCTVFALVRHHLLFLAPTGWRDAEL